MFGYMCFYRITEGEQKGEIVDREGKVYNIGKIYTDDSNSSFPKFLVRNSLAHVFSAGFGTSDKKSGRETVIFKVKGIGPFRETKCENSDKMNYNFSSFQLLEEVDSNALLRVASTLEGEDFIAVISYAKFTDEQVEWLYSQVEPGSREEAALDFYKKGDDEAFPKYYERHGMGGKR